MPKRHKTKKRNYKRRKHTIKRSTKPVTTGGKYIAKGSYGCVYKPKLKCKNESEDNTESEKGYVSKLIAAYSEPEEMAGKDLFEGIDPEMKYFVYPKKSCIPAELAPNNRNTRNNINKCTIINRTTEKQLSQNYSTDSRRLVQMNNGGNDLFNLKLNAKDYIPFFESIHNLLIGLDLAHKNNITHNDIKNDNIVSRKNEDGSFTTRFIDLGLSCKTNEFTKLSLRNQFILFNRVMIWRPFDIRFMIDRYITCSNNDVKCEYKNEFSGFSKDNPDLVNYYNYLLGTTLENFGNVTNVEEYYDDVSGAVTAPSFPKPYILHNFVYIDDHKLADIMADIYARPKIDRYKFVLTRYDIFALGLYLSDIYYQKVGHMWWAKEKGAWHAIYLSTQLGYIPLLELKGGIIKRIEYANLHEKYKFIPKDLYNIHTEIALNVSVPYFILVAGMMHPNILERESLDDAIGKYGEIVEKIREYFKEDKILKFGHKLFSFDPTTEQQIINEQAAEKEKAETNAKAKEEKAEANARAKAEKNAAAKDLTAKLHKFRSEKGELTTYLVDSRTKLRGYLENISKIKTNLDKLDSRIIELQYYKQNYRQFTMNQSRELTAKIQLVQEQKALLSLIQQEYQQLKLSYTAASERYNLIDIVIQRLVEELQKYI